MLGVQFYTGKSSLQNISSRRPNDNASRINTERSVKYEPVRLTPEDVEKMLGLEIKKANELVDRVTGEMRKQSKGGEGGFLNQLREMEESIRRKNITIKQLENQIGFMKSGQRKDKSKLENISFTLLEQIKGNMIGIMEIKKELDDKKKLSILKKHQLRQIFEKYKAKCKAEMKQVIDFNKFKQMHEKRKREIQKMVKVRSNPKKLMSSIWEQKRQQPFSTYEKTDNKIRDTINHRNVAETALKTQRKRHKQELFNFQSKLEFLKDEQEMIEEKIRMKELELKNAEKKFSESRNRLVVPTSAEKRPKSKKFKTLS